MLYRIEVENYLSIRDRQVLDLTVSPGVTEDEERFAPIFLGAIERAPKVVAFYGANASGKTTLLRALEFVTRFVRQSSDSPLMKSVLVPFADKASGNRPISFAIEFGGGIDYSHDYVSAPHEGAQVAHGLLRYELEFEVVDGLPMQVSREALRQKGSGKGRWVRIFERDREGKVEGSDFFRLAHFRHLQATLNPQISVLASFAFFQHPAAQFYSSATSLFSQTNLLAAGDFEDDQAFFRQLHSRPELIKEINRNLSRVDTGVELMTIENFSGQLRAVFRHNGLDHGLLWDSESQGTRAFVRLFPLLAFTLATGGVALIDEFDTLLHPLILPDVLRRFYDQGRDFAHAQLFLSCHSATLLEDLVKEEVVIVEKTRDGRTELFSLMDVKAIRRDDNLYKKYLGGVYGGVPIIG